MHDPCAPTSSRGVFQVASVSCVCDVSAAVCAGVVCCASMLERYCLEGGGTPKLPRIPIMSGWLCPYPRHPCTLLMHLHVVCAVACGAVPSAWCTSMRPAPAVSALISLSTLVVMGGGW